MMNLTSEQLDITSLLHHPILMNECDDVVLILVTLLASASKKYLSNMLFQHKVIAIQQES